jgi:phage terminase large subunit-like protein
VWDLVTGTAETRLEPDGSIIICQQRWHEDDAAGRALATGEFMHINLKAIGDDGSALWHRWPVEELERKKKIVGPYNWASQYEGRPMPKGGRLFFDALLVDDIPAELVVAIGVDLAHTARTSSDWCVALAMGLDRRTRMRYVLDVRRRQARLADVVRDGQVLEMGFARDVAALQAAYPGARTVCHIGGKEDVVVELMGALKESPVYIETMPALTDKWVRHQAYGAAWNRGEIGVPRRAPWAAQLVSEHSGFRGKDGDEDDTVDAAGSAYTALEEAGAPPEASGNERLTAGLRRTRWT